MLVSTLSFAQVLNQQANWPNATWSVTGSYNATYLYEDPTVSSSFSFDDDDAGSSSVNSVAAESPVIDLTTAATAGETWIFFTAPYVYRQFTSASLTVEYYDADAAAWVTWITPFNTSTTGAPTSSYCAGTYETLASDELDISGFTATQLAGFQYRILFDDGGAYAYGFCIQSPMIYSDTPPDCPTPTSLASGTVLADSAEITWVENGGETTWNVQYGLSGFALGTGTTDVVTSNPYTISGLTASTDYDVFVQVACAAGGTSLWEGPYSFTTACTSEVAPYTQDFENSGSIPNCWEQGASNNESWIFATSGGHVGDAGTISGNTDSDGYFAYVDDSSTHNTGTALYTPYVDVSGLTTPSVYFYLLSDNEGHSNVDFSVDVFDGATWQTAVYTSNTNKPSWTKIYIDLSTLTITGPIQVRFVVDENNGTDFYDDVAIDDITFDELPTCIDPSDISFDALTDTSVSTSLTQVGTIAGYNYEYGLAGFTPGTGTSMTAPSVPFSITGLTGNTTYDLYVQADCGGGDASTWVGPFSFTTLCSPIAAPYYEDFENAGSIPTCWNQGDANLEDWIFATSATYVGDGASQSGGYFAYVDDSSSDNTGTSLLTPLIDITTLTNPSLYFYLNSDNGDTFSNVDFSIDVFDGTTWTNDVFFLNTDTSEWEFTLVDLAPYASNGIVQIRFVVDENNGTDFYNDLAIDDIYIDEMPSCLPVSDLDATNFTPFEAELSWTSLGTETAWNIEYGPEGFTPGTGTTVPATSNPFTLTGLTAATDYDFYVTSDCGGGDTSITTGPYSFTTECDIYGTPYHETFENAGSIPNCWEQGASNSEDWVFATSAGYVGDSGAITGSTSSGGYFAYVDDSSPNNLGTSLLTPLVDISGLSTPALMFYLISDNQGFTNVDFSVDFYDGATWNTGVFTSNSNTNGWELVSIDLSSYTVTGPVQARFVVDDNNTTFYDDVAIDDVMFDEMPTCTVPSNLSFSNVTPSGVELAWVENGTAEAWIIEYGPTGFTPGTGTSVTVYTNPATIETLMDATTYDVYIQAECYTAQSLEIGPITFTTDCLAQVAPYTQGFENAGDIPTCWEQGASNGESWLFATTAGHVGDAGTISGSTDTDNYFAYVDDSSPSSITTELYTPWIDVSPLTNPILSFYMTSNNEGVSNVDFSVDFYDGATWHNDVFFSNTNVPSWTKFTIDLSTYTISGDVRARFVVDENNGTDFYDDVAIDDVTFDEAPTSVPTTCPANVMATIDASCGNEATIITWDEVADADGYYLTIGTTSGANDVLDNEDLLNTTSYAFVGEIGATYYYTVAPYNIVGTTTGCTEYMFTTATTGCYCESLPTSNDNNGITNITLGSNSYSVTDVTYEDLTSATVTQFAQGASATSSITFETGFTYDTNIWIDFNDNYIFEDSEIVFDGVSLASNPTTLDTSFMMPDATIATLGLHRMRIGTADSGQAIPNPCYSGSWGVTVDFTIEIVALTCAPAVVDSTNLTYDCANSEFSVDVNVTDLGDGTPAISDGTNTYPVAATGITTVGPFPFGTPVTLTMLHGTNATCDFSIGTYSYDMCPPANDDLCNATSLTVVDMGTAGNVTGADYTLEGSTAQTNEPLGACFSSGLNGSVWFSFVAPTSGDVMVTTDYLGGSSGDTEIAVYSANGVTCGDLSTLSTAVGCDQDGGIDQIFNSIIYFDGTTNALLTPGEMYYIQVDSWSDGSQGSFSIEVIDMAPTKVEDFNNVSFTYYPNPVNNNMLTLSSDEEISTVNISNVLGQEVMKLTPNTSNYVVNMSQLASGTYFVQVWIGEHSKTVKIVKE
ncbi:hypothetical protein Y10_11450 [Neptunitalea sp. Y10]|uniref:T9SS type A sorting domain-containing protein n=2 Tax=Neptunitalea lumnitzerae TaxID=2965509 RepID=A0ABQ5MIL0_9FLAO|nr:hypothetical protein Y10_11450 [Neptunitalea sp. Y10]